VISVNKKEFCIIGLGLGTLIPIILLVLFWWPLSLVNILKIFSFPESFIKIFALTGFTIGIIIDILFLKRLIHKFYRFNKSLLVIAYIYCSFIAVAFFMGLPIGNFLLGIIAGLYIGRRYHYINQNIDQFSVASRNISIFTAVITTLEALPVGFLALQEESLIGWINKFSGVQIFLLNRTIDIFIIVFLCIMLFIIQYFATRVVSKFAFNI